MPSEDSSQVRPRLAMGTQELAIEARTAVRLAAAEQHADDTTCIVHDLKNPIATVSLEVQLLEARMTDQVSRRALAVIRDNIAFMDRLVHSLLDHADPGGLRREATALGTLIERVIERSVSRPDRHRVIVELHDRAWVLADALQIERVVANLIHNALAYSPSHAAVVVRVEAIGELARVSVIDAGPGMTVEDRLHVFDRGFRGSHRGGGSGLGLYLSRAIVELHGGTLDVESVCGRGSRFYFDLPVTPSSRAGASHAVQVPLRGARLLIVDDEVRQAEALALLLREEGATVVVATNGAEAMAIAAIQRPSAVLVDVQLKDASGVAVLELLQALIPGLPAIFVSGLPRAHRSIGTVLRATNAHYVEKPIELSRLLAVLVGILAAS